MIAAEDVEELQEAITCGIDVNEHHNSHMGALNGYSFMAKVRQDDSIQALHIAAYYGWATGVELLLDAGANINAWDRKVAIVSSYFLRKYFMGIRGGPRNFRMGGGGLGAFPQKKKK